MLVARHLPCVFSCFRWVASHFCWDISGPWSARTAHILNMLFSRDMVEAFVSPLMSLHCAHAHAALLCPCGDLAPIVSALRVQRMPMLCSSWLPARHASLCSVAYLARRLGRPSHFRWIT